MGRCDGDECRKVRGNSEWNGGAIHATQVINSKLIEEIVEIEQNLLGLFSKLRIIMNLDDQMIL